MAMTPWTVADMVDQHGKIAVVTGGNSGIGYEAALALAGKGAQVIIAARSSAKGQAAVAAMSSACPQAAVSVMALDLSDIASIRRFAAALLERHSTLDLLINNAGVMALPYRRTSDGFEMQFGTNHLGHFALTGLILPALLAAPAARIVTVSSFLHQNGVIDFENLDGSKSYNRSTAYSQSKLANLLFAYELQRRLAAAGARAISLACHPGYAATNLQGAGPQMDGSRVGAMLMAVSNRFFAQSAAMGALPTLYAATAANLRGGDYIGPQGFLHMRGLPGKEQSSARSHDQATAARLWQVSEGLTGVGYLDLVPR